jgi:hypothetical protein
MGNPFPPWSPDKPNDTDEQDPGRCETAVTGVRYYRRRGSDQPPRRGCLSIDCRVSRVLGHGTNRSRLIGRRSGVPMRLLCHDGADVAGRPRLASYIGRPEARVSTPSRLSAEARMSVVPRESTETRVSITSRVGCRLGGTVGKRLGDGFAGDVARCGRGGTDTQKKYSGYYSAGMRIHVRGPPVVWFSGLTVVGSGSVVVRASACSDGGHHHLLTGWRLRRIVDAECGKLPFGYGQRTSFGCRPQALAGQSPVPRGHVRVSCNQ